MLLRQQIHCCSSVRIIAHTLLGDFTEQRPHMASLAVSPCICDSICAQGSVPSPSPTHQSHLGSVSHGCHLYSDLALLTDRYQPNMYHSFQAILLFLATLAFASVQNADIIFFSSPGSCNRHDDWVYCSNVTAGYCCKAKGPFCARLSCDHCGGNALAAFRDSASCPGLDQADATCTPPSGGTCCLDAGSKSICTGSYCE